MRASLPLTSANSLALSGSSTTNNRLRVDWVTSVEVLIYVSLASALVVAFTIMIRNRSERCPTCGVSMEYIKALPREVLSTLRPRPFDVDSSSAIWRCQEHGRFRIYDSGAAEPFI
jgi:hypothetical protein